MRGLNRLAMVLVLVVGLLGMAVAAGPPLGAVPDGWAVDGGIPACLKTFHPKCYGDTSRPYCDRTPCEWVDNGHAPPGIYCVYARVVELKDSYPQAQTVAKGGQSGVAPNGYVYCEKAYDCLSNGTSNCLYDNDEQTYFCGNAGLVPTEDSGAVQSTVASGSACP